MNLNSAFVLKLLLLLVLHAIADHEERLQHEGVDGVAVCGAATHHRVRVGRGAHQAGARVTGLHNITLLTQLSCYTLVLSLMKLFV